MMTAEELYHGFADHEKFCNESLQVQDKQGRMVPMQLGPAQKKLNAIVAEAAAHRDPVRIIVPKARQVWISVGVAGHFFHSTPFYSGQHTMVLAQDEKTSLNLFSHYKRFAAHYVPFGGVIKLPEEIRNNTIELEWANQSWIKTHTTRTVSIGRSFTLRRVHFSEAAYYPDFKSILGSVMGAMPDDPDTMAVIESTANGVGDEFHRMCLSAREKRSEWKLLFFAWWEHPEYTRPLRDPAKFQSTLSDYEWTIKKQFGLTLEQLHWRRWCIANKLNGDGNLFKQEYPATFEEAFLSSGRPRFSLAHIARMPLIHNAVEGGLEEESYGGTKRINFMPRERGEMKLYQRPQHGRQYVIGADTAEGIDTNEGKGDSDPDYATASVRERGTGDQVATMRARIEPAEFGRMLALLGRYYNMAQIVPEVNNTGIATLDALLGADYPPGLIYHRMKQPDQDPKERADLAGWKTTTVTRPQLISWYDSVIRELSAFIRDPQFALEASTFVIKPNGKAEAQTGCHDDCVIADALSIVGLLHMAPPIIAQASAPQLGNYRRRGELDRRGQYPRRA